MFFLVLYQISIINISESKNSSSYLCRSIYDGFRRFPDNEISKQIVETTNPYSINWQSKFINKNIELFLEKPVDYIQLILSKYFRVWYATDSGKYQNILLLFQLFHLIVYLIMLLFLLLQKIKNIFIISFVLIITYITIIATFNLSIVRYISPFAALYIISSVYFCGEFFQNLKPKILHGI